MCPNDETICPGVLSTGDLFELYVVAVLVGFAAVIVLRPIVRYVVDRIARLIGLWAERFNEQMPRP